MVVREGIGNPLSSASVDQALTALSQRLARGRVVEQTSERVDTGVAGLRVVAEGSQPTNGHGDALRAMQGRWKHPVSGMKWYKHTKRTFATLPEQ